MEYIFINKQGENELVKQERWCWGVVYDDGTELKQFDSAFRFHQFQEINQPLVKMFVMFQPNSEKRIDLVVPEGAQLFHFYRNFILNQGTTEERKLKVFCFGWKIKGETTYFYILPDDRLVVGKQDLNLLEFNI